MERESFPAFPGATQVDIISEGGSWSHDGRTWHHWGDRATRHTGRCQTCGALHKRGDLA